jgi:hypothetical protein
MSSWRPGGAAVSAYRFGYHQKLPEGTFKEKTLPATVVSAFYKMKSKHSLNNYMEWIRRFLESTPCHLVFFTEEEFVPFIEECRKEYKEITRIVSLPRKDWVANTGFPEGFWEAQHGLDPESNIHSPELYKVWYEKKEFVKRAIELNPFGHEDFVWTDAGIFRDPQLAPLVSKRYPVASRIPTDRILILNNMPFTSSDDKIHTFGSVKIQFPRDKPRIGAGVIAGSRQAWKRWDEQYNDAVKRYIQAGLFIGKEQTIMACIALENKSSVSLLDYRQEVPTSWFYLLIYLGASDKLYTYLRTSRNPKQRISYDEMLSEAKMH